MNNKKIMILYYFIVIIFNIVILGVPISALILTFPLILPFTNESLYILLVLFLQLILLVVAGSFFSGLLVKKELNNTITNLGILNDGISDLLFSGIITQEKLDELKKQYYSAKIYELITEDFKLLNYYSLVMRKGYLEKLISSKDIESK